MVTTPKTFNSSTITIIGILFHFVASMVDTGTAFVITLPMLSPIPASFPIHTSGEPNVLRVDVLSNLAAADFSPEPDDTVRVRIWRALASSYGKEMTLKELGAAVGERRIGELRSHLQHVEKQSKTLKNKSAEWKVRRGLSEAEIKGADKARIKVRRGKKNEIYVKLH